MKRLAFSILALLLLWPGVALAITGALTLEAGTVYNLKSQLRKGGSPVTLADGTTYIVQNRSGCQLLFADEAAAPAATSTDGFAISPHEVFTFKVETSVNPYIWALTQFSNCSIVVGERP